MLQSANRVVISHFARIRPFRHRPFSLLLSYYPVIRPLINSLHLVFKPLTKATILITTPFLIMAESTAMAAEGGSIEDVLKKMEDLYERDKLKEAYECLLPHKDLDNVVVQWKFARLCYRMGKMKGPAADPKQFAQTAMKHIDKAVAMDPNNFNAQKWRGIILSWACDFEGYKKKIEKSYEIKENFDNACKLNPTDPTVRHLLGRWSYEVADVPWYMRSAAKYILAELPGATYEDALKTFLEAEKIEEGFFSQNWLYIGKCYYSLGKKEQAKEWLKKAAAVAPNDQDNREAKTEAEALLKKIG